VFTAFVGALVAGAPAAFAQDDEESRPKTEFTPAPLVGGSSDLGVGGGVIASLARVGPKYNPYLYRLEFVSTTFFKSQQGHLKVPYFDNYLDLEIPDLVKGRMKLELRAAYTREATLKYYGIGDAAKLPSHADLDDPFYEYDRIHPEFSAKLRERIIGALAIDLWLTFTYNRLDVPADTLLAEDAHSSNAVVRNLITTFAPHSVATFSYGVEWDTRDNEVSPTKGQWETARVDLSPGGYGGVPQRWGRADGAVRFFVPVGKDGSALAIHGVGDFLFGDPPFYELSRFDDTGAFGGPNGVRGIPAQRYHGMVKLFGQVEFRKMLFHFHALGKSNGVEAALFADGGRLWATYHDNPELDGTGVGLKYGLGGGARLVAGTSFVLRGDIAWSPDARPICGYIAAGNAF
jgi:outer membrane protein assembly factor BamA